MHFIVTAWDHPGDEGLARRDATRPAHASSIKELWEAGRVVLGGGIKDDDDVIRGSLVIVDYPSRAEVDAYLAKEPFMTEGVWDRVEVHPVWIPDFYLAR